MTWFRNWIWEPFFVNPLKRLYFHGPDNIVFGLGFWQGVSQSEICAKIKNTSERTWEKLPQECELLTDQLFQSFLVTIETLLWFYLLIQILFLLPTVMSALVWRYVANYKSTSLNDYQRLTNSIISLKKEHSDVIQ